MVIIQTLSSSIFAWGVRGKESSEVIGSRELPHLPFELRCCKKCTSTQGSAQKCNKIIIILNGKKSQNR